MDYSSDEFKRIVRETFNNMYSGWTDEDLSYRPKDILHFTKVVGAAIGRNPNSYLVMGALTNPRKDGGNAFGKKTRSSPKTLENQLKATGLDITVPKFKQVVTDLFRRDRGPDKAEEICRRPHDAIAFCDRIRAYFGLTDDVKMPDQMILRTLNQLRRAKKLVG